MKISARVDVVRDGGRDDGEDVGRALAALVEPGEEPVLPSEDEPSKLAFPPIVGRLNVPIIEEEEKSLPLAMEVAEAFAERRLRRNDGAMLIEPRTQLIEDRSRVLVAPCASLLGRVAREHRDALDGEDAGDDAESFERDLISGARGLRETSSAMRLTARPLAARALDEAGDVGAIALDGARVLFAEEAANAVGVSLRGILEGDPARIGPTPDGAEADPLRRLRVEHGDAGGVGREQSRSARLFPDRTRNRREQIDRRADASAERLRVDIDAVA